MNKCILMILDGYGEGKKYAYNAVENANTPILKKIKSNPYALLDTSGEAVGLFDGDMGGSEVGHTTIGAGRIVRSTAKLIHDEIANGNFEKNKVIVELKNHFSLKGGDLHLVGLMSDKNIHSDINHCLKLIDVFKDCAKHIYIHFITDGRDSGQFDSIKYLDILKSHIKNVKNCQILSISGRVYAMDRENHIDRTQNAVNAMFLCQDGIKTGDIKNYLEHQHDLGHNDQFVEPKHIDVKTYEKLKKNDCIFFFNFREDRMRQIGAVCEQFGTLLVTMSNVGGVNSKVVYPATITKNTLSEYLSQNGLKQIKISESTKYAHVTYFLNGGLETPFKAEDRIHIPSLNVTDFSETPKMKAEEITDEVIKSMDKDYDAIIVNYSNPDMIGHTGDYEATLEALECLDKCVGKVIDKAKQTGYAILMTADHGNAETMRTKTGEPHLAHTLNPVFCTVVNRDVKMKAKGGLKDVAPTFVNLLGLKPSKFFEGESLIL